MACCTASKKLQKKDIEQSADGYSVSPSTVWQTYHAARLCLLHFRALRIHKSPGENVGGRVSVGSAWQSETPSLTEETPRGGGVSIAARPRFLRPGTAIYTYLYDRESPFSIALEFCWRGRPAKTPAMAFKLEDRQKVAVAIAISFMFFASELAGWCRSPPGKKRRQWGA